MGRGREVVASRGGFYSKHSGFIRESGGVGADNNGSGGSESEAAGSDALHGLRRLVLLDVARSVERVAIVVVLVLVFVHLLFELHRHEV